MDYGGPLMKSIRLADTLPASFGTPYSGGQICSCYGFALRLWAHPYGEWFILLDFSGVIERNGNGYLTWWTLTTRYNPHYYEGIQSSIYGCREVAWTTVDL